MMKDDENQCLKWDDLEFSYENKYLKVKLNDSVYNMRYTRNALLGFGVVYFEFNKGEHIVDVVLIECKKQFFDDLHLERVD